MNLFVNCESRSLLRLCKLMVANPLSTESLLTLSQYHVQLEQKFLLWVMRKTQ